QPEAARALGVSERTVRKAAYVRDHGSPSEVRAVERGDIRVDDIERALRSRGDAKAGRERDARQFYQYVRRLPQSARAFTELGRRVQVLAKELGMDVQSALDAGSKKALTAARDMAGELVG